MARPVDVQHTIKRTTVDLDLDDLQAARKVLGTETAKDTIHAALRDVARRAALSQAAALILEGGLEIIEPDELAALRQTRLASE
jgi:Arc/MetJ family transcription regulator